jgi:hypothetical protein
VNGRPFFGAALVEGPPTWKIEGKKLRCWHPRRIDGYLDRMRLSGWRVMASEPSLHSGQRGERSDGHWPRAVEHADESARDVDR